MQECKVVNDGTLELYCTVHHRTAWDCFKVIIEKLNGSITFKDTELASLKQKLDAAGAYANDAHTHLRKGQKLLSEARDRERALRDQHEEGDPQWMLHARTLCVLSEIEDNWPCDR